MTVRRLVGPARTAISLLIVLVAGALPAAATLVPQLTPEEVRAAADRVVVVTCLGREVAAHPTSGFPVTEWRFRLESVEKGAKLAEEHAAGREVLVVRQAGGTTPEGRNWSIVGMPSYEVGGRYRLFLHGDSRLGLTSPVGLGQGVERLDGGTP